MPKTTYEDKIWKAVRINERALIALYSLFNDESKENKSSFTVKLSDSSRIEGLTIEELFSLPNSSTRAFEELRLWNSVIGAEPKLNILISQAGPSITYSISGQDKQASYINGELLKLLKGCYQPFGYLFCMPPIHVLVWIILFAFTAVLGANFTDSASIRAISVSFFFVPLVWGFLLVPLLMPSAVFEVGDGVGRSEELRTRRSQVFWLIIGAVVVAVPIGLFVNYVYDKIK